MSMASVNLSVTHVECLKVLGTKYLSVNIIVIDVDVDLFSHDTVRLLFNKMIELRSGEVECVSTVGLTR